MEATKYLEASGRTESFDPSQPVAVPEFLGTHADLLRQLVDFVYFGYNADLTKRALFYKTPEDKLNERNEEYEKNLEVLSSQAEALSANPTKPEIDHQRMRLIHAALGMVSEAGEIIEEVIKSYTLDRPVSVKNIREELGDNLWYVALGLRAIGADFEDTFSRNINKLSIRYKDKFTPEEAAVRDLDAEDSALA